MLVWGGGPLQPSDASAQKINFDQINKFESLRTGTIRVGAPPKTIIDDGERHVVVLTIWDADAETKGDYVDRGPKQQTGYRAAPSSRTQ